MSVVECLWCETSLKPGTAICRECGLRCPTGETKVASRGVARTSSHRGRRVVLALLVVPLMLSAAFVARAGGLTFVPTEVSTAAAAPVVASVEPPANYSDPLQRAVWISGVKAVKQVLAQPNYGIFSGSYVDVAAGHVVSFCGEVAGTSGYDSASGAERFVSVFGQTQSTTLEGNDPSFAVLWTRACTQNVNPA